MEGCLREPTPQQAPTRSAYAGFSPALFLSLPTKTTRLCEPAFAGIFSVDSCLRDRFPYELPTLKKVPPRILSEHRARTALT